MTASAESLPLYGRKYKLTLTLPPDESGNQTSYTLADSENEPEALRITFDVRTVFYQVAWAAEICIYNLDFTTTNKILGGGSIPVSKLNFATTDAILGNGIPRQGMLCTLSAGYQNGKFGVIWSGPVFQATFERIEAVDFKVTLHCLLWLDQLTRKSVFTTFEAGLSQSDLVQKIAASAFSDKPVEISSKLKQTRQSRGGVLFGSPRQLLNQVADESNSQWFLGYYGIAMARIDDDIPHDSEAILFRPPVLPASNSAGPTVPSGAAGAIIGTPQQTQYGVRFTALLDPTVGVKYPAQLVRIDNSQMILG